MPRKPKSIRREATVSAVSKPRRRKILGLQPLRAAALLAIIALLAGTALSQQENWARQRRQLVERTIAHPRDLRDPVRAPRVLNAMRRVPRHEFVPPSLRYQAYEDHPVPIGHGQTISQPYMVAKMTELLELKPGDRVLEVGTGSGYQAAVLAELVREVYTIEIIEPLGLAARLRLERLGYENVEVRVGDGYYGWPDQGPFDAIIVTAWSTHVPPPLVAQLKPGGRMVIPVGNYAFQQNLIVVRKGDSPRDLRMDSVMPVVFVPLLGEHPKPQE
ncbi:protein-L-isoaspartate(D-aspartate) O-methyltransferase [Acidobacteriia bacterium AH_259_A11_L15]|nr:protein-L-isoaspartate(D-aspartate) O-methyltransferase [Acidobacteriia bacterium AH_259_A11_L15]